MSSKALATALIFGAASNEAFKFNVGGLTFGASKKDTKNHQKGKVPFDIFHNSANIGPIIGKKEGKKGAKTIKKKSTIGKIGSMMTESVKKRLPTWDQLATDAKNVVDKHVFTPLIENNQDVKHLIDAVKEHDVETMESMLGNIATNIDQKYGIVDFIKDEVHQFDEHYGFRDHAAESAFEYLNEQPMSSEGRKEAKKTVYKMLFDEDLADDSPMFNIGKWH